MNEEERKAIEHLGILKSYCCNKAIDLEIKDNIRDEWANFICDFQILKNLIEKQEQEIEKLKTKNNDLLKKLRNRTKDVKKLQKYGVYKKEFATLNKRIEKQEKIINEMAKAMKHGFIIHGVRSHQQIIEYFTKKVGEENDNGNL